MRQFVCLAFTLLGVVFPVLHAHAHANPPITIPSKDFEGVNIENRTISSVQCFPDQAIDADDFTTAAGMLTGHCRNFKLAIKSPYVAIVGQTMAYVCAEGGPEVCSGKALDAVQDLLTEKCGSAKMGGLVRLGEGKTNGTLYGRGQFGSPLCEKLSNGLMKNYQFYPITGFINGSLVEGEPLIPDNGKLMVDEEGRMKPIKTRLHKATTTSRGML
ncbi:hypothetical protein E4U41_002641 [Claviceps citrina]|nr:hypothetical protein E4U41_002641 [Claviceps citrina]